MQLIGTALLIPGGFLLGMGIACLSVYGKRGLFFITLGMAVLIGGAFCLA